MKNNTITWCTDGSYHRTLTPDVSGVGWIVYYAKTNIRMTGNFFEISDDASSYRGKKLGLCATHHLIAALCIFYNIKLAHHSKL